MRAHLGSSYWILYHFFSPISASRIPRASENLVLSVWETSILRSGSPEPIRRCLLPLSSVVVCGALELLGEVLRGVGRGRQVDWNGIQPIRMSLGCRRVYTGYVSAVSFRCELSSVSFTPRSRVAGALRSMYTSEPGKMGSFQQRRCFRRKRSKEEKSEMA